MLDRELDYFIENQQELVEQFGGQVLVIVGEEVVGVHPTPLEAYLAAKERFALGDFMVQPCEPGAEAYTVTLTADGAIPTPE